MKKLLISLLFLSACTSSNVNYVKENAEKRWNEMGYKVIGYEGYEYSVCGGNVWYHLKRDDFPGIIYSGFLCKWKDELHIYDIHVISGNQFQLNGARK